VVSTVDKNYRPRGQICQLFDWVDGEALPPEECMVEGPAGTGKSRGIGEFLYEMGDKYHGTQILALRRFRADLHKGFQRTFEDMVLHPGNKLLTRQGGGRDSNRDYYHWPNGSRLLLGNMEDPQRWYSFEADIVYWNEMNEARLDQWERLDRCLRRADRPTACPFSLKIGDTNPDSDRHWAHLRCKSGRMHRIITRHRDNPSLEPAYLNRLSRLTGVRRRRLYLGEWCSAEGQIFDNFDSERIICQPDALPKKFSWYMAGLDFGSNNPGCLLIAGFDSDGACWVIREVYRRGRNLDWWTRQVHDLNEEFPLSLLVCDSADGGTGAADLMNERLGLTGSKGEPLVQPVHKRKVGDKRWGFASREHVRALFGQDLIRILDDPFRLVGGPDPELTEKGLPRSLTDEIPQFVYKRPPEGRELAVEMREDPDPMCADHGIDALINIATAGWASDFTPPEEESGLPDWSYAGVLDHASVWAASQSSDDLETTFDDYTNRVGGFIGRRRM
jgi:hypothetical protein